jgi:hypothetical protein
MREFFHKSAAFHESSTYPVWVRTPDQQMIRCTLGSVSEYTALLELDEPCELPERFDLLFSSTAQSWRDCLVVRRGPGPTAFAIRFLARHVTLETTARVSLPSLAEAC